MGFPRTERDRAWMSQNLGRAAAGRGTGFTKRFLRWRDEIYVANDLVELGRRSEAADLLRPLFNVASGFERNFRDRFGLSPNVLDRVRVHNQVGGEGHITVNEGWDDVAHIAVRLVNGETMHWREDNELGQDSIWDFWYDTEPMTEKSRTTILGDEFILGYWDEIVDLGTRTAGEARGEPIDLTGYPEEGKASMEPLENPRMKRNPGEVTEDESLDMAAGRWYARKWKAFGDASRRWKESPDLMEEAIEVTKIASDALQSGDRDLALEVIDGIDLPYETEFAKWRNAEMVLVGVDGIINVWPETVDRLLGREDIWQWVRNRADAIAMRNQYPADAVSHYQIMPFATPTNRTDNFSEQREALLPYAREHSWEEPNGKMRRIKHTEGHGKTVWWYMSLGGNPQRDMSDQLEFELGFTMELALRYTPGEIKASRNTGPVVDKDGRWIKNPSMKTNPGERRNGEDMNIQAGRMAGRDVVEEFHLEFEDEALPDTFIEELTTASDAYDEGRHDEANKILRELEDRAPNMLGPSSQYYTDWINATVLVLRADILLFYTDEPWPSSEDAVGKYITQSSSYTYDQALRGEGGYDVIDVDSIRSVPRASRGLHGAKHVAHRKMEFDATKFRIGMWMEILRLADRARLRRQPRNAKDNPVVDGDLVSAVNIFADTSKGRLLRKVWRNGSMPQAEFMNLHWAIGDAKGKRKSKFRSSFQNNFGMVVYKGGRQGTYWATMESKFRRPLRQEPGDRDDLGRNRKVMLVWDGPTLDQWLAALTDDELTKAFESMERAMTDAHNVSMGWDEDDKYWVRELEKEIVRRGGGAVPNPSASGIVFHKSVPKENPGEVAADESLNMAAGRWFARQQKWWKDPDGLPSRPKETNGYRWAKRVEGDLEVLSDTIASKRPHMEALDILGHLEETLGDRGQKARVDAAHEWGSKCRVMAHDGRIILVVRYRRGTANREFAVDHELFRAAANRDARGTWQLLTVKSDYPWTVPPTVESEHGDPEDASAQPSPLLALSRARNKSTIGGSKLYWYMDVPEDAAREYEDGQFKIGWWMETLLMLREVDAASQVDEDGWRKNPSSTDQWENALGLDDATAEEAERIATQDVRRVASAFGYSALSTYRTRNTQASVDDRHFGEPPFGWNRENIETILTIGDAIDEGRKTDALRIGEGLSMFGLNAFDHPFEQMPDVVVDDFVIAYWGTVYTILREATWGQRVVSYILGVRAMDGGAPRENPSFSRITGQCDNCRIGIPGDAEFCPHCGANRKKHQGRYRPPLGIPASGRANLARGDMYDPYLYAWKEAHSQGEPHDRVLDAIPVALDALYAGRLEDAMSLINYNEAVQDGVNRFERDRNRNGQGPMSEDERAEFMDGYGSGMIDMLERDPRIGLRENPSGASGNVDSPDRKDAVSLYEIFWKLDPKDIGEFPSTFKIPSRVEGLGKAIYVMYSSGKKDPETLEKPKKPIDYIHHFKKGVHLYVPSEDADTDVPSSIVSITALTLLGDCLGYKFKQDGKGREANAKSPMPELYATPDGKCLIVIQDKKEVLAMFWGGNLAVEARGIIN